MFVIQLVYQNPRDGTDFTKEYMTVALKEDALREARKLKGVRWQVAEVTIKIVAKSKPLKKDKADDR